MESFCNINGGEVLGVFVGVWMKFFVLFVVFFCLLYMFRGNDVGSEGCDVFFIFRIVEVGYR